MIFRRKIIVSNGGNVFRPTKGQNILLLNVYWFGLSFMWNAIHPIILPVLLLNLGGQAKNTLYGLLTFLGLLIALIIQPISGALSDYTQSPLGRRRPWMILGSLLNVLWLFAMVSSRGYWGVAISYMGLQFSSNLAHGPAQGLIPDLVSESNRGAASGVKSLVEMLGVIGAALAVSRLVGSSVPQLYLAAGLISIFVIAGMAITVLGIREESTAKRLRWLPHALWPQIKAIFRIRLRRHSDYARLLLSRFCVLLGTYTIQAFALYYFADVVEVETPVRTVGNLMTVIGLSVLVSVYPAGVLSERWGRKRLVLIACGMAAVGMGLLAVVRNPLDIWMLGILIGLGMGVFTSVNWAWATDLVPVEEAGKYLGLSNLATAGSAAVSRLFGPLIDVVNGLAPNAGYSLIFVVATLGVVAGFIITLYIPDSRVKAADPVPRVSNVG